MLGKKRFIQVAALILSFALFTVGCSSQNASKPATSSSASSAKKPKNGEKVTIRLNMGDNEVSKDQIAEFNNAHSDIHLERVDTDFNKLMSLIAADSEITPDIIRVNGANEFPFYAARGLTLNLEPYFKTSSVFKTDDLLDIVNIFRWDGQKSGSGDLYGFVKDWSPDFNILINKKLFTDAGISIPSDKEPLTWDQVMDYAKKLTKKEGEKFVQWGLMDPFSGGVNASQDILLEQLASAGQSLYSSDNSNIILDSPEAKKLIQSWVDAVKTPIGPSSLNSEALNAWDLLSQNKVGMLIVGYFVSGIIRSNDLTKNHMDDFMLLPSPVVAGGKRMETARGGTGGVIYSKTRHPDEAWTVFEWFFGGSPADDRAKSGWGLPGFKSKMALLPTVTNFDKQTAAVVNDDLNHLGVLLFNPYISATAIGTIFDKYMTPVYFDKDTVDGAIDKITKEVRIQIRENKDIVGVK